MTTVRWMLAAVVLFLAGGWGATGHRIINGEATRHLPPAMAAFVAARSWLADSASVPDWRRSGSRGYVATPSEGPRHFLDVDDYPEHATRSVSTSLSALIAQYGSSRVYDNGTLPWAIGETMDSLTAAMQRRELRRVWSWAADLGHYVADGHNPLHCTIDYNGRSTMPGSSGIHSRYESAMVDRHTLALTISVDTVHYVADPVAFALEFVYDAQALVDTIYAADLAARTLSGWSGSGTAPTAYLDAMWQRTGTPTRGQFQRGSVALADLFYTAWVDAGRPDLSVSTGVEGQPAVPTQGRLLPPYPNPFNPATTVAFVLAHAATVRLELVGIDGRVLASLADGRFGAGEHRVALDAGVLRLASGMYLIRLTGADDRPFAVQKILLLR